MLNMSFTSEDINNLKDLSKYHPHPAIRQRALIVLLKCFDTAHNLIEKIADVSENTVRKYLMLFQQGGIKALEILNFRKGKSKLESFKDIIVRYFTDTPPHTMAQACAELEKLTGAQITKKALRQYAKILGLKYRKTGTIPAKADTTVQEEFLNNELQPRLDEAKQGKRTVFFVDAAHFVLGAFLGFLWSFTRVFVRSPSGRQRFNVLGALNAITKELITVTNNAYITSIQVCELLDKISKSVTGPITIILDNARYQRCHLVMNHAKELGIELLFLPSYSPNLNLIERLWKMIKKECLNSRYYENFALFSSTIKNFMETMNQTHQAQLNSLLTLNFQLYAEKQYKSSSIKNTDALQTIKTDKNRDILNINHFSAKKQLNHIINDSTVVNASTIVP